LSQATHQTKTASSMS